MNKINKIANNLNKLAATDISTSELREAMKAPLQELATQKADIENVETLTTDEVKTIENIIDIGKALVDISNKTNSINLKLKPILVIVGQALQGL
jgi:hypothetical protein